MAGRGFLIAISVVLVGLIAFAVGFWSNGQNKTITPVVSPTITVAPKETTTPTPISSENIKVTSPAKNETVSKGFILQGEARVFENVLNYKLLDSTNKVLVKGDLKANALDAGQFGPFVEAIHFTTSAKNGVLEVYSLSPKDGSEINNVTIPLNF